MPALIPCGKLDDPFGILRPQVNVNAPGFGIMGRKIQVAELSNPRRYGAAEHKAPRNGTADSRHVGSGIEPQPG